MLGTKSRRPLQINVCELHLRVTIENDACDCTSGDLGALVERVEDALVQADEVDGRMLQFEGGLSVTSVVLTGAAALTKKAEKKI